jgi:hypothetical protein
LNLDVSARRGERLISISLVVASVTALSLLPHSSALVTLSMFGAAIGLGWGFCAIGWIGGQRRLTRIVCQSEGHWLLCDAGGRTAEATLSPASRITSSGLWLQWRERRGRPLLLLPGDVSEADLRRLTVRLRLSDRLIPDGQNDEL